MTNPGPSFFLSPALFMHPLSLTDPVQLRDSRTHLPCLPLMYVDITKGVTGLSRVQRSLWPTRPARSDLEGSRPQETLYKSAPGARCPPPDRSDLADLERPAPTAAVLEFSKGDPPHYGGQPGSNGDDRKVATGPVRRPGLTWAPARGPAPARHRSAGTYRRRPTQDYKPV